MLSGTVPIGHNTAIKGITCPSFAPSTSPAMSTIFRKAGTLLNVKKSVAKKIISLRIFHFSFCVMKQTNLIL